MALEPRLPREIAIHRTWILETRPDDLIPSDEYEFLLHHEAGQDGGDALEERCFSALLPLARRMVADYRDQIGCLESSAGLTCSGREPHILCALCPGKKALRGWEALILHLKNYWKKRVRQHRAFLRALKEALRAEVESLRQEVGIKSWPPVLLVGSSSDDAGATFDGKLRRLKGLQGEDIPQNLAELKLLEVLAVYSKGGSAAEPRIVVAYPSSEVGFVDAKQLEFRARGSGPAVEEQLVEQKPLDAAGEKEEQEEDDALAMTKSFCGLIKRHDVSSLVAAPAANAQAIAAHDLCDDDDSSGGDEEHALDMLKLLPLLSEAQQCAYLREKWGKSFGATKQLKQASKLNKSAKKPRKEVGDRFQQELKSLDRLNVDGKLRMRLQLEEIEKQLNKERLGWLRSVDPGRSQLDSTSRELEITKKVGDVKSKEDGGRDDRRKLSEKQEKDLEERVQAEKRKRFLIAKYQQEQISLKKQADLAKRERAHLINIFRSSNF